RANSDRPGSQHRRGNPDGLWPVDPEEFVANRESCVPRLLEFDAPFQKIKGDCNDEIHSYSFDVGIGRLRSESRNDWLSTVAKFADPSEAGSCTGYIDRSAVHDVFV